MKRSRASRRGHGGAARVDLTPWRKLFADTRKWCVLARVALHDGESSHFETVTDETGARALFVDVVTIPDEIELSCRLPATGGLWRIPALGREVIVGIPDGAIDFVTAILGVIESPSSTGGLSETVSVIEEPPGGELHVHDGNDAQVAALALRSDVQAIYNAISGAAVVPGDGGAAFQANLVAALNALIPSWPVGTTVLKAK